MQTMRRTIKFKRPLDEETWVSKRRAPGGGRKDRRVHPTPGDPLKRDLGTRHWGQTA